MLPRGRHVERPDDEVVSILRAPPGNMSSISYGAGSTVGTVEQITSTSQFGQVYSFGSTVVDGEGKWTVGSVTGHQDTLLTTNVNTIALSQTSNTVDHAYDTFYIWLNPILNGRQSGITAQLSATMTAAPTMRSPTGGLISSLGPDGQPRMQVVPIAAHALANPSARTPAQHGFFGHLTPEQIAHILALDDLYASPGYDPGAHPESYRYVTTLELNGPELGAPVVPSSGATIQYDSSHDTIDGHVNHQERRSKLAARYPSSNRSSAQVGRGTTTTPVSTFREFSRPIWCSKRAPRACTRGWPCIWTWPSVPGSACRPSPTIPAPSTIAARPATWVESTCTAVLRERL